MSSGHSSVISEISNQYHDTIMTTLHVYIIIKYNAYLADKFVN